MKKYISEKVKVLKQMDIFLSQDELEHMKGLRSEISIDNFARGIILHRLGKE